MAEFKFPEWMRCEFCRWWVEPSAEALKNWPKMKGQRYDADRRPLLHCRRYPTIVERRRGDICGEFIKTWGPCDPPPIPGSE